ncbi:hypothetical protein SCP_0401750 [Sparassis crispa]|uniref:F-box domain-containing protein n=1 Tax=Sparassis crispa TaxID=139825 RepID=A0A401GI01_9APHY|nr:hypothetical protein SCP_0401750 [Sparassis crispa]GBE81802.1 hypothetical protein SCP_0401750 [Sparassis crispa]
MTQREAELELIIALKNLAHLTFFKWRGHPNVVIAKKEPDGEDVWTSLTQCRNLKEIDALESFMDNPPYPIWGGAIFRLSNLTSFEYWTAVDGIAPDLYGIDTLGIMLRENCPKLQKLYVGFSCQGEDTVANVERSIMSGRWPDLHSLHLEWAACSPSAAVSFLAAHPQITDLSIDEFIGSTATAEGLPLDCPPELLPNIKTLECTTSQAADILSSASSQPRPLEHLSLIDLPFSSRQAEFLVVLTPLMSIRTLQFRYTFSTEAIARVAEAAPWLPRLQIGNSSWLLSSCRDPQTKKRWQKLLEPFFHLEALDSAEGDVLDAIRGPLPSTDCGGPC